MEVFFRYSVTWIFFFSGFLFQMMFLFLFVNIISILKRNHQSYVKQKLSDEISQDKSRKVADVFIVKPSLFILFWKWSCVMLANSLVKQALSPF